MAKNRYVVDWSLDETRIYLDEETLDEREVEIKFIDLSKKLGKKAKLELLKMIIKELEDNL